MGKRRRSRGRSAPEETVDYTDAEGNVLTLRGSVSAATAAKIKRLRGAGAATTDDVWRRRTELLFERFTVCWIIAGLPLTAQKELLGRYRMADGATQTWVRQTLDEHVRAHQPELAE
jgi:hypothetical protein